MGFESARPMLGTPDWLAAVSTAKPMNARGSQIAARMSVADLAEKHEGINPACLGCHAAARKQGGHSGHWKAE